jgi:hypothetical protein
LKDDENVMLQSALCGYRERMLISVTKGVGNETLSESLHFFVAFLHRSPGVGMATGATP